MRNQIRLLLTRAALATVTLTLTAAHAAAADPVLFARRPAYVTKFLDYWSGLFKQSNGITLIVIAVGIVSLFIITRGKWRK